ncbi:MAG TPA: DUF6502 family protein [Steroidobacteraceae bacterium]|nr:DUF6502 family protein [Steroidobacteraceae bacterium]
MAQALVPVAKLCMKSGMGAGELQIAVKIACISVAAESAKLGNRLNHSRIAAATGLTRKEVRTLFGLVKSGGVTAGKEVAKQRTTRVLHGWRTDPEFLDRRGSPVPLIVRGPGLTFHTLVRRYAGDVTPISVLNELVRTGAVSIASSGRVAVRKTTPRVKGYGSDVVSEVAQRLRDFGATLVGNIERPETPIFVGFNEIPGLSADEAALFQVTFSDRAASLVDGVDRWRTSQARIRSKARSKDKSGVRVGLGVFLVGQQQPGIQTVKAVNASARIRRRGRR